MNRVRIVALAAVALGGAVFAGTQFQKPAEPATVAAPAAAVAPVATSEAAGPVTPQPQLASAAPLPSLVQPEGQTGMPAAGEPTLLAQASVLPAIEVSSGPAPVEQGLPDETLRRLASLESTPDTPPLDPALQAELDSCAVWLVVTPAPGAMLETSVYAPCDGGAPVTLTHAGLSFDTFLGADGQLMAQVPALSVEGEVTIRFSDGREQGDMTEVTDLDSMTRVVLQWQAPALLVLHAYEFGATYGGAGHVYAGAPRAPGQSDRGFLTVLGDPAIAGAHLAQVYSYPRGEAPRSGGVALEIEVPVTDATCNRSLTAHSIELHGTAPGQVREIRLDMPECDGNGGFVVLPGVLPDLRIALN